MYQLCNHGRPHQKVWPIITVKVQDRLVSFKVALTQGRKKQTWECPQVCCTYMRVIALECCYEVEMLLEYNLKAHTFCKKDGSSGTRIIVQHGSPSDPFFRKVSPTEVIDSLGPLSLVIKRECFPLASGNLFHAKPPYATRSDTSRSAICSRESSLVR